MRILTVIAFISIALISCKGTQEVSDTLSDQPDWVKAHPITPSYYVGVGMAPKAIGPNCVEEARKKALQNLSEEIRVNISANSILFSFEDNQGFRDEYKNFIQVRAAEDLHDYEMVDSYENDREYWVYYRLSKAKYEEQRRAKIQKASNIGKTIMLQGDEARASGDLAQSLRYYGQAIIAIEDYLGETLPVELDGRQVYLGSELAIRMGELASTFDLDAQDESIQVILGQSVEQSQLKFNLMGENHQPVAGMPIAFEYNLGIIYPRQAITDNDGAVACRIDKIRSESNNQMVVARVDFEAWGRSLGFSDEVLLKVVQGLLISEERVVLEVQQPRYSLEQSIQTRSEQTYELDLTPALRSAANQKGFIYSSGSDSPDLLMELQGKFSPQVSSQQLAQISFTGRFIVRDRRSNNVVFTDDIVAINGVQMTEEAAQNKCEEKLAEYLRNTAFQRFYRFYLK